MFSRSQQGTPPPVAHSSSNAIPAFFGQAFIVTNCASILGRATAHHLAEQGANLALCDPNKEAASSLLDELGDLSDRLPTELAFHFVFSGFDVTDKAAVQRFVSSAFKKYGGLSGLVCCVDPSHGSTPLEDIDESAFDQAMRDVKSTFLFNQAFVQNALTQQNKQRPAPGGGYSIVNFGSVYGKTGGPIPESASKHAIHGLTRSVAKEHGKNHIRANLIVPGLLEVPTLQRWTQGSVDPSFLPLKRAAKHEEVARCVGFLLSNTSSYITGSEQVVDGGWLA